MADDHGSLTLRQCLARKGADLKFQLGKAGAGRAEVS
jgi:hypothetical protein